MKFCGDSWQAFKRVCLFWCTSVEGKNECKSSASLIKLCNVHCKMNVLTTAVLLCARASCRKVLLHLSLSDQRLSGVCVCVCVCVVCVKLPFMSSMVRFLSIYRGLRRVISHHQDKRMAICAITIFFFKICLSAQNSFDSNILF